MCGIAGILNLDDARPVDESCIRQMLAMLRHRGPDEFGIYLGNHVALGNARLSILDLATGQQPIGNEDGSLWIVLNGEVFNHSELRSDLEARGHRFSTQTDTEVVLHLYEDLGPDCLPRLNGQFAFAIWNARDRSLFLARDRVGICPLFYTVADGALVFGSEIKALACHPAVSLRLDPLSLAQVFTYWVPLTPRSVFQGITGVPPGGYLIAREGRIRLQKYWEMSFATAAETPGGVTEAEAERTFAEEFRELLVDAVRIRLRADVPVGAYLSGGLDSSVIASIAQRVGTGRLDTFSVSFSDAAFDESPFQRGMAGRLGTAHQVASVSPADIARVFPEVIWHTEAPVLRTAPAPMFLLSRLARDAGYKVVLTGEGADEFLAGYDIFKEAKVRRFWARQPASTSRPRLLQRLYADIARISSTGSPFLSAFFGYRLTDVEAPDYSHAIRWRNTSRTQRFFSEQLVAEIAAAHDPERREVEYPGAFGSWGPLERSQYLEAAIFLPSVLALFPGGPHDDGPFRGRPVSVPGPPGGGVLQSASGAVQAARAPGQVPAPQGEPGVVTPRHCPASQAALSGAYSPVLCSRGRTRACPGPAFTGRAEGLRSIQPARRRPTSSEDRTRRVPRRDGGHGRGWHRFHAARPPAIRGQPAQGRPADRARRGEGVQAAATSIMLVSDILEQAFSNHPDKPAVWYKGTGRPTGSSAQGRIRSPVS